MNKADRSTAKPEQVDSDLFDLFATLGASDEQMEYPLIFASAKQGWASLKAPEKPKADTEATNIAPADDMIQLFDLILKEVPAPTRLSREKPFSMLTTQIDHDPYVGMLYLGRVESGLLKVGDKLVALAPDGTKQGEGKVTKIFGRVGLDKAVVEQAGAGEIVSVAGISKGGVNCTLVSIDDPNPQALPVRRFRCVASCRPPADLGGRSLLRRPQSTPLDPPTVSMFVSPNDSPFAGKEGTKLTAAVIKERLFKEAETNVALKVIEDLRSADSLEIRGRGVLHLGILLEELRREGFELAVSPPKPVLKRDPDTKQIMEPIEEATILVDSQYIGVVIEKMTKRKAEILTYDEEDGKVKVVMEVPARGLLGYVSGGECQPGGFLCAQACSLTLALISLRRVQQRRSRPGHAQPHLQGV